MDFKIILIKQIVQENNHIYVQTRDGPRHPIEHPDKRFSRGHHFSELIGYGSDGRVVRRKCIVCNYQSEKSAKVASLKTAKRSHLRCIVCKVTLCEEPCHFIYHTEIDYKEYQKKLNRAMENRNAIDNEINMDE